MCPRISHRLTFIELLSCVRHYSWGQVGAEDETGKSSNFQRLFSLLKKKKEKQVSNDLNYGVLLLNVESGGIYLVLRPCLYTLLKSQWQLAQTELLFWREYAVLPFLRSSYQGKARFSNFECKRGLGQSLCRLCGSWRIAVVCPSSKQYFPVLMRMKGNDISRSLCENNKKKVNKNPIKLSFCNFPKVKHDLWCDFFWTKT